MNQVNQPSNEQRNTAMERKVDSLRALHKNIISSEEYKSALSWGKKRTGHPEGTLGEHLKALHSNLNTIFNGPSGEITSKLLSVDQLLTINILIDSHDIMKPASKLGVPISHPKSHASLASQWLRDLGASNELCHMVQLHDENHALFRMNERSHLDESRLAKLLYTINDWDTFLVFQLCDKITQGRNINSMYFLLDQLDKAGINYTIPARELIRDLCEHNRIPDPLLDHRLPPASTSGLVSVTLNQLPGVKEIQSITSMERMNQWLKTLRTDIEVNPAKYYQSEDTTECLLDLTAKLPLTYKEICGYLNIKAGVTKNYPELAILVLEKVRN